MKTLILLAGIVFAQGSQAAWPETSSAAVKSFKSSKQVQAQMRELQGVPKGPAVAIRLSGMGDGCELMESYLVTQQIKTEQTFYTSVVSAIVNVETLDQECAEERRGYKVIPTFSHVVDLVKATATLRNK